MSDTETKATVEFAGTRFGRLSVGLAVVSGLVMAACISGLPSASCAAMVETYGRAVEGFGATAFSAVLGIAVRMWLEIAPDSIKVYLKWAAYFLVTCSCAFLLLSTDASLNNIKLATLHCFVGSNGEVAERSHQRIALYSVTDWGFLKTLVYEVDWSGQRTSRFNR
jgi:hypothetical protein